MFFQQSKEPSFTEKEKKLLKEIKMGEQGLGSILPVFDAALKLVDKGEVSLTPINLPNLETAKKLNALLPQPIELGLKRPVTKSYPHVLGLFLLLRASGLTMIDSEGKTPKLVLQKSPYELWQSLNSTERYFILLETWLLRASAEIIEEWDSPWGLPNAYSDWAWFYEKMPEEGYLIAGKKSLYEELKYRPRFYNLGLLDLFGFIHIERGTPMAGQVWQIERIRKTAIGDAFLKLLFDEFFSKNRLIQEITEDEILSFGAFQSVFKTYFPDWGRALRPLIWSFRAGQYIFRLSWDKMWRRLAIDGDATLDDLAMLSLESIDFDSDHLYRFTYYRRTGQKQEINHPYLEEYPTTSEFRVGDLPIDIGEKLLFVFDFGDNWEFNLSLEAINEDKTGEEAEILESHGEAPEQYPDGHEENMYFDFDEMAFFIDDGEDFEDEDEDEDI